MTEIIDYTTGSVQQVTVDGAMTRAQREAVTRSVPSRRPATDNRSELQRLTDRVTRLEVALQDFLNDRYPDGIFESRTT